MKMADTKLSQGLYEFGPYRLYSAPRLLLRDGATVPLTPKALDTLKVLVERAGQPVSKEELMGAVWPDTFVEDSNLAQNISALRKALTTTESNGNYIETIAKRGYRFVAEVRWIPDSPPAPVSEQKSDPVQQHEVFETRTESVAGTTSKPPVEIQNDPARQAETTGKRPKKVLLAGLLSVVTAIISTWLLWNYSRYRSGAQALPPAEVTLLPLTSTEGEQTVPALSPDGSRVVFMRSARAPNESGLYAAVVGSQSLLRLTQGNDAYSPAWSPNGREIAFLRDRGDKFEIETVPALGGAEQTIYSGPRSPLNYETGKGGLSFSPGGQLLAFSEWNAETQRSSIKVVSLRDFSTHFLTSPPPACHDRRPAFSTGGDKVAFIRSSGPTAVEEVFVVPVAGGEPKQITFDHKQIFGPPGWTKGDEIIFSSSRGGLPAIWRVQVSGGIPRRVPGGGPVAWYPSLSLSGNELAYERVDEEENLWRLQLTDQIHARAPASILVSSAKTQNLLPQFSPDGGKIAFQSVRSGYPEVWICNSNGSDPEQLTDLRGFAGGPRWSPDGRYLAFDYRSNQHSGVYIVATGDGHPHPVVVFPDADSFLPSWSRDGRWIYFTSNRGEKHYQIWKQAVKGWAAADSAPIQLTRSGAFGAVETSDGKMLLYTKPGNQGIWAMPPGGGVETPVWGGPGPDNWSNWAVTKDGIYFFAPQGDRSPNIEYFDFETRRLSHVGRLEKPSFYGLAISPDGRSLLYSEWDRDEHQVIVMEHFR